MRIFSPIIDPTSGLLTLGIPNDIHRRAVGSKSVRHDRFWMAVSFHRFTKKPQRSLAIPLLRNVRFQKLALMVNSSPEIVGFAVDPPAKS